MLNRSGATYKADRPVYGQIQHAGREVTLKKLPNSRSSEALVKKAVEMIGSIEKIASARAGNRGVMVCSVFYCNGKQDKKGRYFNLGITVLVEELEPDDVLYVSHSGAVSNIAFVSFLRSLSYGTLVLIVTCIPI